MKSNVGTHRKKRKDMNPVLLVERRKIIYLNFTTILNYMLLQTPLLCNKQSPHWKFPPLINSNNNYLALNVLSITALYKDFGGR